MSGAERIAITGLGSISACGRDTRELLEALRAGRSGLRPLSRFSLKGLSPRAVGQVAALPGSDADGSPTHRLALAAAREAAEDAELGAADLDRRRVAVIVGTTTGGIGSSERWYLGQIPQRGARARAALQHHPPSTVGESIAGALGLSGPRITLSTACSSAANAIGVAADMLRAGEIDAALAGGADALCQMTYYGFSSLRLLSATVCRPFDRQRDGLSLGEAAAMLLLEPERCARSRGARPHAYLAGSACTCDAYHMTAPRPDGSGAADVLRRALARAGVRKEDIGYINAHGTGTEANDLVESETLRAVFGEPPPVSSSKSFVGHTLGAAGAIEAVITVLALREGLLPATLNTEQPLAIAPADLVLGAPRPAELSFALSSSFGFGGNNAALVFSREAA